MTNMFDGFSEVSQTNQFGTYLNILESFLWDFEILDRWTFAICAAFVYPTRWVGMGMSEAQGPRQSMVQQFTKEGKDPQDSQFGRVEAKHW